MASKLELKIITPEGVVYDKEVDYVSIPTQMGEIGVLPMHAPLFALISEGELIARRGTSEDRFLITGGCVEVTNNAVSILTIFATNEAEVNERQAEEARRKAEERMKEFDRLSPEEQALVQAALAHSLAQLKVKRRGSSRSMHGGS